MSTQPSISIYVIYKEEFARNGGKFQKAETYRNDTQRQRIIDRFRAYLHKYCARIKVFELYEQPGNKLILKWPDSKKVANLSLWLLYRPEHRAAYCDDQGRRQIIKYFLKGNTPALHQIQSKLLRFAAVEIDNEKLWLARLYMHPGNHLLFSWEEDRGEVYPGGSLATLGELAAYDDLVAEIEAA